MFICETNLSIICFYQIITSLITRVADTLRGGDAIIKQLLFGHLVQNIFFSVYTPPFKAFHQNSVASIISCQFLPCGGSFHIL